MANPMGQGSSYSVYFVRIMMFLAWHQCPVRSKCPDYDVVPLMSLDCAHPLSPIELAGLHPSIGILLAIGYWHHWGALAFGPSRCFGLALALHSLAIERTYKRRIKLEIIQSFVSHLFDMIFFPIFPICLVHIFPVVNVGPFSPLQWVLGCILRLYLLGFYPRFNYPSLSLRCERGSLNKYFSSMYFD
jgi:hypothetical protein